MDAQGQVDARFGPVRERFAAVTGAQPGTGAALAAWCEGRQVVDLWGGHADRDRRRPWDARSLAQPYSVSKPFAAVCALRLAEAGRPDLYRRAIANPPGAQDAAVVNSAAWRAAEIPALNGHGTAGALAGFYHALAAGRLLSPGMLAEAVTPQRTGPDLVFGHEASWGLGFAIDGDDGYGMAGLGGNYAGTSTAGGYTIAFVTGSVGNHDRLDALDNTLRDCLGLPPFPAGDST